MNTTAPALVKLTYSKSIRETGARPCVRALADPSSVRERGYFRRVLA